MGWFAKRPQTLVPGHVLSQLAEFGKASWQAKLLGQPNQDPRFQWDNFLADFMPACTADFPRTISEVHDAAGNDPFSRYGGYQLCAEFDSASKNPKYLNMMDAVLDMMFEEGLTSMYMTGYERDRWQDTRGDVRTTFDRIVQAAGPAPDAAPPHELLMGEVLLVARMGPEPLDNQFWVESTASNGYGAFSMRQWDSDSTELTRCEEAEIGRFGSLDEVLAAVGSFLGTPPYWSDPALEPYFPFRREL